MNAGDIAFPNLGIYLDNVPRYFNIFGFEIYFYGVFIVIGMIAGFFLALRLARATGQDPDTYWDFALIVIFVSVLGARIYYVIFEWDSFKDDLLSIFNIRNGGLAIYGGVIAAFITLFIFCRIRKLNALLVGEIGRAHV